MKITLSTTNLKELHEGNPMMMSYNVEFAEVTGGTFWKGYTEAQIAGTEPFVLDLSSGDFMEIQKGMMQVYPPVDLYNERIRKLAKAFGPAWIRVSGTWATKTYYDFDGTTNGVAPEGFDNVLTKDQWIGVLEFVKAVDGKLMVSVSNCDGIHSTDEPWTPVEAEKLFSFSKEYGVPILAAEFMNEPNMMATSGGPKGYDAPAYARDQDPQKADFTFYGGIYRDVEFLIVNKDHFELDYYNGPGIKYTTEVKDKDAMIRVWTYTKSDANIFVQLHDAKGRLLARKEGKKVEFLVEDVHLWDGLDDPYLYTIKAFLEKDGEILDEIGCNCGVRTFEFSPKDGFHLNGRSYPLHGVSRHQDFKGIGNAISKEHHDRDMALIKEVGANTIRLAHYQHDQYFYDLCDREGMIVWAEIPYISEHLANGNENTISQMKELIIQNYNHPCIVVWGVSNEITISGARLKKQMLENHRVLNDLCHEMDPTRPTTLACYAMCPHWHPVAHITDLVGWNLYLGWYVPGFFLNDWWIKFFHFLYPNRCLCYSEYGAEGMPNLHSKKPKRGDNSEEYHSKYHEYMLECFKRHPYMWAHYYWNMFDFAADARNQGGEPGMNHKGLITFDRKTKKDAFYLYKAYWNKKDKFVYLAGKRYEYRSAAKQTITVYSNLNEVSLYHNGKLVGIKKGESVFKFDIVLEKENKLEVKAGKYKDSCVIYKVEQERPEYKVAKVDSSNWM